ncbi:MAG: glyoxylase-like metal-dependent hydrolase (beta-lactamase superfamily II) [Planctomycetaceae bacterium]|jgi:glyoxylase-like metal-dependent hydrolase (beta-lactamase superfamily II)
MYANNPARRQRYQNIPNLHLAQADDVATPEVRLRHRDTLTPFGDWQMIHSPGHSWD